MDHRPHAPEDLLAHAGWIRRLARSLVSDPHLAEDLVQDTWVAALRRPPRTPESGPATRAFLARVLTNLVRQDARGGSRRRQREELHAESVDRAPSLDPLELLEEVESQRVVVEELLQLAEPYRGTLLLRYFRGLSSAEIARREKLPGGTVRSRLQRGLEELRVRLDARHGGRRDAWSLGILAWARPAPPLPTPTGGEPGASTLDLTSPASIIEGMIAMKATTKLLGIAGLLALAAVGVSKLPLSRITASEPVTPPELTRSAPLDAESTPVVEADSAPARESFPATDPGPDLTARATKPAAEPEVAPAPVAHAPATVEARFVDAEGFAVAGVDFGPSEWANSSGTLAVERVLSDREGRVRLSVPLKDESGHATFSWRSTRYAPGNAQAALEPGAAVRLGTIVLAAGATARGRVIDEHGHPIEGAAVWTRDAAIPKGNLGQLARQGPRSLDFVAAERSPEKFRTTFDGSFEIPAVPFGGARIWAHADGRQYAHSDEFVSVEGRTVEDLVIVLPELEPEDRIAGMLLSEAGDPLPRHSVQFGFGDEDLTMSSSLTTDAKGRFELVLHRRVTHVFTARGEANGAIVSESAEPGTLDLVLQLGRENTIELRVTNLDGDPVEAFEVTVSSGTENMRTSSREGGSEHPGGIARIGIPASNFWFEVDAPGYARAERGPFPLGTAPDDIELVLDPVPAITGRVLSDGAAVAGARVRLYRVLDPHQRFVLNGYPAVNQVVRGGDVKSEGDGSFSLMARDSGQFLVRAEVEGRAPLETAPFWIDAGSGRDGLELHLGAGGRLVVQVLAPPGEDASGVIVAVNRGDGEPFTTRADAEGRARFDDLVPGRWNVRRADEELKRFRSNSSMHTGDSPFEMPWVVEVREGQTARYSLVLSE